MVTLLMIAIAANTFVDNSQNQDVTVDIDELEEWKADIERRLEGRWMKADHERWVERLREMNPDLSFPLE